MRIIKRVVNLIRRLFSLTKSKRKRLPKLTVVLVRDRKSAQFRDIVMERPVQIHRLEQIYGVGNVRKSSPASTKRV